jgi:uncharacterized protein (TIGR03086 family)
MTEISLVETLRQSIAVERGVFSRVRPDQLTAATPCSSWDVAAVINHSIGAYTAFAGMAGGSVPATEDPASGDYLAAFDAAAVACLAAFSVEGVLETEVVGHHGPMPAAAAITLAITDGFVHAWDIARATGQSTDLAPELAAAVLASCRQGVSPEQRGPEGTAPFGPEQAVADDAPTADKLAAFLGRTV